MKRPLALTFALGFAFAAHAQNSGKDADLLKARQSWTAFECAAVAEKAGNFAEQARLFTYGLAQGRDFLKLASEGRFTQGDLHSNIPTGFWLVMKGPSADFVMGRLWESTVDNALRDVTFDDKRQLEPEEIAKRRAQTKFDQTNCAVVGR